MEVVIELQLRIVELYERCTIMTIYCIAFKGVGKRRLILGISHLRKCIYYPLLRSSSGNSLSALVSWFGTFHHLVLERLKTQVKTVVANHTYKLYFDSTVGLNGKSSIASHYITGTKNLN
jgi:hypothetical protein